MTADCRAPEPTPAPLVGVTQRLGSWSGVGDHTIGFASNSGKFRLHWETRLEPGRPAGRFRLTVHSAVSGRPLQEVADHRGAGEGTLDFEDDPRPYNLMVESADLRWSVTVDEVVLVRPAGPAGAVH